MRFARQLRAETLADSTSTIFDALAGPFRLYRRILYWLRADGPRSA